jgi:phenylpropionate dioxygenase-like ring-hydroxylating dioxygenase large terminal subunit
MPAGTLSGGLAAALAAVDRPIGEARGLPSALYTDPALALLERETLLNGTWLAVGTGARVPRVGDILPLEVLGLPLILVRGRDGRPAVFHNVCSHRGLRLVEAPCRRPGVITCPYHAWAYGLDGRLRSTPSVGGPGVHEAAGIDRARLGLKRVRTATWFDVVFVDLSGEAPDFATWIAPLARRWDGFDPARFVAGGPESRFEMTLACNWKLAVENYCEAYHLPAVHPSLNSYSRLEDHYNIAVAGCLAGQGTTVYRAPLDPGGRAFPALEGLAPAWQSGAEYVALFPNLLVGVHKDHMFTGIVLPQAADSTRELFDIGYFSPAAAGDDFEPLRRENARLWQAVFEEDRGVVEGLQRGRASPVFDGGVFSPALEAPSHAFHAWVARRLLEATLGADTGADTVPAGMAQEPGGWSADPVAPSGTPAVPGGFAAAPEDAPPGLA